MDGGKTGERLGELSQSVKRVDVGGLSVPSHGGSVEHDSLVRGPSGFVDVAVVVAMVRLSLIRRNVMGTYSSSK